jgi:hypothetical protein
MNTDEEIAGGQKQKPRYRWKAARYHRKYDHKILSLNFYIQVYRTHVHLITKQTETENAL